MLVVLSNNSKSLLELTQDCILTFTQDVNLMRSSERFYSTDEAYTILRKCEKINDRDMTIVIPSTSRKGLAEASAELCTVLTGLLDENKATPLCAVYTCPPYTVLLCKPPGGNLSIIDTHPIPYKFGEAMTAGIITSTVQHSAIPTLIQWLINRMGQKEGIYQELTVLTTKLTATPCASDSINSICGES